jgi:hypothetical protein
MSVIQCQSNFLDPMRVQVFVIHVHDSNDTKYSIMSIAVNAVQYVACVRICCRCNSIYERLNYMYTEYTRTHDVSFYYEWKTDFDTNEIVPLILSCLKSHKFYKVGSDWVATPATVHDYLINYGHSSELTIQDIYKLFRADVEVHAQYACVRIPSISPDPYVRVLTFDNMRICIQRGNRSFRNIAMLEDVMKFEHAGRPFCLPARYLPIYEELTKYTFDGEFISPDHIRLCYDAENNEKLHGILEKLNIPPWQRTLLLEKFECKPIGAVYDATIRGFYDIVTSYLIRDIAAIVWEFL